MGTGRPPRDHWRRVIAGLDPRRDWHRIHLIDHQHEFPWDLEQALGLALFRTFAVPSIGGLLDRSGEFARDTQRRYDDTGLILDTVLTHGMDSAEGRAAIRRMNQMHHAYPIDPDDLRYVLSTFVTVPIRWLDRFGWRPFDEAEKVAACEYYRALGRRMAIPDLPATWREFAALMDRYERERFARDPGGTRVAEATLRLLTTTRPHRYLPPAVAARATRALLEPHLLDAFGWTRPTAPERAAVAAGLRARAALLRHRPPRLAPRRFVDSPNFRSHPDGWDITRVGTFPAGRSGCPVPHTSPAPTVGQV